MIAVQRDIVEALEIFILLFPVRKTRVPVCSGGEERTLRPESGTEPGVKG